HRRMPHIPLFCDNSHICGNRIDLKSVAQYALDLNYDGLMTEIHFDPDHARSDAQQQITPEEYRHLLSQLVFKRESSDDQDFLAHVASIRQQIDNLDLEVLKLIAQRMELSKEI